MAALGSSFSKLGLMSSEELAVNVAKLTKLIRDVSLSNQTNDNALTRSLCHLMEQINLRVISLTLVVLCNIGMWLSFTIALSTAPNTLHASIVNSSTNFIATVRDWLLASVH
jgi:hypothetical protein